MMQLPTYHIEGVVRAKEDRMEDFSGPLDLILALLSKNRIEIRDIRISLILEQYLEYLDEMKRMDLEIASEFIVMASHLMQLKTKMLLTADDEETLSELELLMQSLEQRRRAEIYGLIKTNAELIAPLSEFGRSVFFKQPEPRERKREYVYQHDRRDLRIAMEELMQRSKTALPPPMSEFSEVLETTPFPVTRKAAQLVRRLIAVGKSKFRSLFAGSGSRSEIVATFIALLELCRTGTLAIDEDNEVSYTGSGAEQPISVDDTN